MTNRRSRFSGDVLAAAAMVVALAMTGCSQTPPTVTFHSFQQAQRADFVCMHVNDENGNALPYPVPVVQGMCAPVPPNGNGTTQAFHLYAVVTQSTLGAVAVVDLTAGAVVDVNKQNPGIDFIPVGADPTDVAVTPDGQWTYVSCRDPNRMAIYAINNYQLLGSSTDGGQALQLADVSSCALPQPPQSLAVVAAPSANGGASEGGADGGTGDAGGSAPSGWTIVATLQSYGGSPAVIATIDPSSAQPGSLGPCTVLGATQLSAAVPSSWAPGPAWPDGVPYADAGPTPVPLCVSLPAADGGADGSASGPAGAGPLPIGLADGGPALPPPTPHPTSIAMRNDAPVLYVADDAVPVIHVIDLTDPANPAELPQSLLATSVSDPTRVVSVGGIAISPPTHDYKIYLYAVDARQGSLMVYDITSDPRMASDATPMVPLERPHPELNPRVPPDRIVFPAPVATVAFAEHDWPLPSQASPNQTVVNQYSGILCNPNPNANPDAGVFVSQGAYYRADQTALIQVNDTQGGTVQTLPTRLRGVFGFATRSDGIVEIIDVDDWDAPCRRPDPMQAGGGIPGTGITGVLDVPEPEATGPDDLDPYHAPETYQKDILEMAAVTLEAFFPVSAPHRPRVSTLLRLDPSTGVHIPNLVNNAPQLFNASGAPVGASGPNGSGTPLILPTPLYPGFIDPSYIDNPTEADPTERTFTTPSLESASAAGSQEALFPGSKMTSQPNVRIQFDDPTAHQDQSWSVTYEGTLPTVSGIAADIDSSDPDHTSFATLKFSAPGAGFCARGIEDWNVGKLRASAVLSEMGNLGLPAPPAFPVSLPAGAPQPALADWTADYIEITDDPLPNTDPYWGTPTPPDAVSCWDGSLADSAAPTLAQDRFNFCQQTFGSAADADSYLARDLPILNANDDSLEVGRFAWYPTDTNGNAVPEQTTNRIVVSGDPSNAPFLRLIRCCFHHQAAFKVRTGGEWVTLGSNAGLLHQVVKAADGSCTLSCDPNNVLMNARSFDVPWWKDSTCAPAPPPSFDRDSPIAMRNPMFSFVNWAACGSPVNGPLADAGSIGGFGDHTLTTRDLAWKFSVTGSPTPLTVSIITPANGSAVSPQSMRFIPSLGQMAVVDGEAQGLVIIDLNLVTVAKSYY